MNDKKNGPPKKPLNDGRQPFVKKPPPQSGRQPTEAPKGKPPIGGGTGKK